MKLKSITIMVLVILSGIFILPHLAQTTPAKAATEKLNRLRIGVYDSRAIIMAYKHSDYDDNFMVKKSKEKKQAEQAGDTEKAQKIDALMTQYSIRAHSQVFSTTPVHDLLKCIKERIPQIAKETGVDVIVSKWDFDYLTSDAELMDVTMQLVQAFKPKPGTKEAIEGLLKTKPMTYEEIVQHEIQGGH